MDKSDKGMGSTSMFEVESILSNDGEFVIAEGHWNGEEKLSVACRWHAQGKSCGYPQTFGKPQWMLLPVTRCYIATAMGSDYDKKSVVLEF